MIKILFFSSFLLLSLRLLSSFTTNIPSSFSFSLLPFLLILFSYSSSFSLVSLPPSQILPFPSLSNPTFLLSSSSNPTKAYNATLPLHTNLHDHALPLHGNSLNLCPFLAYDPSFSILHFLLTLFSSSSSFSLSFPLFSSPPLTLHPPIPLFSSPFSNPIHEAFNIAISIHAKLYDPALLLHDNLLHLLSFLIGNPLFPLLSPSSPSPRSLLLLVVLPLFFSPSPPSIQHFSSSSSSNPIHETFNIAFLLHANFHNHALLLHDGSLHLYPFLPNSLSFLHLPFILISFFSLLSSKSIHEPFPFMMAPSTFVASLRTTLPSPPSPLLLIHSSSFNPIH